jgi:hypothetical protein
MPRPVSDKDILANMEKQVQNLTDEMAIRAAATTQGLACSEILAYVESQPEPFVANDNKDATPGSSAINPWHKNPGGGGGDFFYFAEALYRNCFSNRLDRKMR